MTTYVTATLKLDGNWYAKDHVIEDSDKFILDMVEEDLMEFWQEAEKKVVREEEVKKNETNNSN